ncbi:transcriptional regulator [Vibrio sp. HA2012]|uniref:helix-turn-helix transcriptional regulator n=1 Tax=Vibrio sp. HA2012 TaxID=1971595 RepID=UPI000C2BA067|nr:metalloregulator ArsR/SmtB family transcription factor [Vibrio sp. HA2012]PJC85729.1 transcriptional regulator [Vibrio sp. HA2012]
MKTPEKILHKLKREGSITAKKLAGDLGMTTMGARQHLQALEDDGMIESFDVRVKVGRPNRNWSLTEKGHAYFSDRHDDLSVQVIEAVETLFGTEGIHKVAQERENKTFHRYQAQLTKKTTLQQKLECLTQLREQEGYMAELHQSETGFTLIENHCPICKAAERCPSFCQSELNVFQRLLGDSCHIERSEHIINSERRCVYLITEK